MPAYDRTSFTPPAPVAQVSVRTSIADTNLITVSMLIDTGADVTLLPRVSITSLIESAATEDFYELEGFDGVRSVAQAVRLELLFLGRVFRGQFLIIDQDRGILGRNVLNAIPLLLDGPNLLWNKHDP